MVRKRLKAGLTNLRSVLPPDDSPDEVLGELLRDVQLSNIHVESKNFVDAVSEQKLRRIAKTYVRERAKPGFDLRQFVERHFRQHLPARSTTIPTKAERTARDYIESLWPSLTRTTYRTRGSLMALPYPYVVPGGRFAEQYYWDSYFTMLGLRVNGHTELITDMVKNCAYLIRKTGFIPTANRTYYLSRSQPPFFALMIDVLAEKRGRRVYARYLPYLLAEYRFWMRGRRGTKRGDATRRVARMPDGSVLNRYFDAKAVPRPESFRQDTETAAQAPGRDPEDVYRDIRAGAESGWDFSSRWFGEAADMPGIHTTDIIPVDLNCLLYELEQTISLGYSLLRQGFMARRFRNRASKRAAAIRQYCWSEDEGFFFDYDFRAEARTPSRHMAAVYPLYFGIATQEQAARVADTLQRDFLHEGGFVTTLVESGQQWDAPNGWASLQWLAYKGLRRYGLDGLAADARRRWLDVNLLIYKEQGKFYEKYNVTRPGTGAGGGEYPRQEGFGMTNGVFLALQAETD